MKKLRLVLREDSDVFTAIWVNTKLFDELWKSSDWDSVDSWKGDPKAVWFLDRNNLNGLILPTIYPTNEGVAFNNGKHRTRWLIQQDISRMPIAITKRHFEKISNEPWVIGEISDAGFFVDLST